MSKGVKLLYCGNNKLYNLNGIEGLTNLRYLYCGNNQLYNLNGIEGLINLTILDCASNNLSHINNICDLNELDCIYWHSNQIEYIPPNIVRKLISLKNNFYNEKIICSDLQNIDNHKIKESVRKSINNILEIKPQIDNITDLILNDYILTNKTKEILINYSKDTNVHAILNITFNELLIAVFNRIYLNENKNEIKEKLNTELNISICESLTERINRLINCLNGFDKLVFL